MREYLKLWEALTFAFTKHGDKKRISGDIPYVVHPIRVTMILKAAGFNEFENESLILAALFHDLLEDTDLSFKDLQKEFGNKVATIVRELTKPEEFTKKDWLQSFKNASKEAKVIKMADRIDNLMDMKLTDWTTERKKDYAKQGLIILEKCGDANQDLALKLKETINYTLKNF
ncbi:MAG: HD domain-containing protein [Promethearchaeota archaeon]|jgi:guanosine-3',5'-bis(diphosphate) 3'-pyrophosphohydrolase